ncbi:MAG: rhodanese-related sulfurtransferase [Rubripirellula sp.]|nr:rhodanese-related sulfurtransferase [Rubripirellula sp.]
MNSSESPVTTGQFKVAALYRFVPLNNHIQLRETFQTQMESLGIRGTLLLAHEGINGTLAGTPDAIDEWIDFLRSDSRLTELEVKYSYCDSIPFKRCRVRLKKEIVTMGVQGIDPLDAVGTYVDPQDWNELISDPDVVLIDTRNDYEVAIGSFKGADNPQTHSFREFPDYVRENLDPQQHKKVAMYCTGGIRCEKSTALLKQMGFEEVYHLKGGILKYLNEVPTEQSQWEGECFVFDGRVSVSHGLHESDHVMCFGCGWPVTAEGQQHPDFVAGVQCSHCASTITEDQRKRFAERQRQLSASQQDDA